MKHHRTNAVQVSKHEEEKAVASDEWRVAREEGQRHGAEDPACGRQAGTTKSSGGRPASRTAGRREKKPDREKAAAGLPHPKAATGEGVKEVDAKLVWKQLEDVVVPRLRLSVNERVVYYHLLRHSRLQGKVRYRFSIASLGRGTRLSGRPVRVAVRRLADLGALRLIRRSKTGHVVEVRVPEEIRGVRFPGATISGRTRLADGQARPLLAHTANLEDIDFMQTKAMRQAIHVREGGRCFYCLRRLAPTVRCLDHVVPLAQSGRNSYRNLVSCCLECNSQKGERPAEDFVRWLYRERRLTATELAWRLRALDALSRGKLRPAVNTESKEAGK